MDCDTLVALILVMSVMSEAKCKCFGWPSSVGWVSRASQVKKSQILQIGKPVQHPPWPMTTFLYRLWHSALPATAEEKVTTSFRSSACDLEWKTLPRATQSSDFKREAKAQHPKTWSLFTCIFQKDLPAKWPLTIPWSWSSTQNKHLLFGAMKSDTTVSQMKENNTSNKKLA